MNCLHPVPVRKKHTDAYGQISFYVPCGRCAACRVERTKAWALRLMMESLYWKDSIFLTLTYDEEHLPTVRTAYELGTGHVLVRDAGTLVKDDLQRFWKRLRKDLDLYNRKIKYYAVGEYGSNTFRPHYHAIVFGLSRYDKELIEENWPNGMIDIGDVGLASCNYVAGYIQKKLYGDVSKEVYGKRLPPFCCMSKGLGRQYLFDNYKDMLRDGFIRYKKFKIKIPRYYWDTMLNDSSVDLSPIDILLVRDHLAKVAENAEDYRFSRHGLYGLDRIAYEESERDARELHYEKSEQMFRKEKEKL